MPPWIEGKYEYSIHMSAPQNTYSPTVCGTKGGKMADKTELWQEVTCRRCLRRMPKGALDGGPAGQLLHPDTKSEGPAGP